uniref:inositol-1,3,4-trisphosphate 5/6-kinase n=1 Tax=Oncorhynchus mykiss TaxID=8022 RepID=A0A8C7T079_ONCMY
MLSDVIVEAEYDSQSQQLLDNFQGYVSVHPHTVLLDPLPAMSQLLDRFASKQIMSQLQNSPRSTAQWPHCPSSRHLPICKTKVAHGSRSHEVRDCLMAGLSEARPPCVLQSFVNHGAVLHKVFVLGEDHFTVERLSLNNFSPGPRESKTIFFNSHQVSKPEFSPTSLHYTAVFASMLHFHSCSLLLNVMFSLYLSSSICFCSPLPGHEGVPQFFSSLLGHIESVLDPQELEVPQATCPLAPSAPQHIRHSRHRCRTLIGPVQLQMLTSTNCPLHPTYNPQPFAGKNSFGKYISKC